jgi:hypothetical protein
MVQWEPRNRAQWQRKPHGTVGSHLGSGRSEMLTIGGARIEREAYRTGESYIAIVSLETTGNYWRCGSQ